MPCINERTVRTLHTLRMCSDMAARSYTVSHDSDADVKRSPYDFCDPMNINDVGYTCVICTEILRNTVETPCGHLFCESCLQKAFSNGNRQCPSCKVYVGFPRRSLATDNIIKSWRIRCVLGCPWKGHLGDADTHIKSKCPLRKVICKYCSIIEIMKDMAAHELKCHKRLVPCEYCKIQIAFDEMVCHVEKMCGQVPIPCPNCCEEKVIIRCKLTEHLYTNCSKQEVECKWRCGHKFKREEELTHYRSREFWDQHIEVILKDYDEIKKVLENMNHQGTYVHNILKLPLEMDDYVDVCHDPSGAWYLCRVTSTATDNIRCKWIGFKDYPDVQITDMKQCAAPGSRFDISSYNGCVNMRDTDKARIKHYDTHYGRWSCCGAKSINDIRCTASCK